jgi:methionine-rich copper-binding protein CopC
MKTQTKNPMKTIATSILFFLVILVSGTSAMAHDITGNQKPGINYLGKSEGQHIVQVNFENANSQPWALSVQDADGNILYTTKFNEQNFSKKFQVAQGDAPDVKLTFVFTSGKTKHTQTLEINTSSYTVEDVTVTKL